MELDILPETESSSKLGKRMPRAVKCPSCRQEGHWFDGPYGPFCSKRCKLVDLGKWLNEENKITEPLRPDHFQEYEKLPADEDLDTPKSQE